MEEVIGLRENTTGELLAPPLFRRVVGLSAAVRVAPSAALSPAEAAMLVLDVGASTAGCARRPCQSEPEPTPRTRTDGGCAQQPSLMLLAGQVAGLELCGKPVVGRGLTRVPRFRTSGMALSPVPPPVKTRLGLYGGGVRGTTAGSEVALISRGPARAARMVLLSAGFWRRRQAGWSQHPACTRRSAGKRAGCRGEEGTESSEHFEGRGQKGQAARPAGSGAPGRDTGRPRLVAAPCPGAVSVSGEEQRGGIAAGLRASAVPARSEGAGFWVARAQSGGLLAGELGECPVAGGIPAWRTRAVPGCRTTPPRHGGGSRARRADAASSAGHRCR